MATPALQKARAELCVRLARVTVLRASMRPLAKLCEPAALPREGDRGVGVCCEQAQEAGRASPPSRIGPLRPALLPTAHTCHLPPALRPPPHLPPVRPPRVPRLERRARGLLPCVLQGDDTGNRQRSGRCSVTRACAEGTDGGVSHCVREKPLPKTSCTFTG